MDDKAYVEMVLQWEKKNDLTADGMDGFFPAYRKEIGLRGDIYEHE